MQANSKIQSTLSLIPKSGSPHSVSGDRAEGLCPEIIAIFPMAPESVPHVSQDPFRMDL